MGMADRARIITVKIPKIVFTNGYRKINTGEAVGWSFLAGLCLVVLFVLGGLSYAWISHIVAVEKHPPKVVTKTVYQSALDAAQQAYIKNCSDNTKEDEHGNNNPGVPDVHSHPWTCTYPH